MSLLPLGILSSSGAGGAGAFELISTTILGSSATTIIFSSIPSTFKHLQIRGTLMTTAAPGEIRFYKNSTTSGYWSHYLEGNGSSVVSGFAGSQSGFYFWYDGATLGSTQPVSTIIDYLDYTNTNKNPTVRAFSGRASSAVRMWSSSIADTSTPTSLTFTLASGQYAAGTRISLYGVKGE